jgi:hypothetical protein
MTALERLVLSLIFDAKPDSEALYFHTSLGPSDAIGLSIDSLRAAFDASAGIESTATTYIAEPVAVASTDETEIEIDFSGMSWEFVFQDIVRRSSTLRYVTAVTSFTCSKMRPDGFGGMAVLITGDAILGKSTNDILEDFLEEREGNAADDGCMFCSASAKTPSGNRSTKQSRPIPRSPVLRPTLSMTPTSTPVSLSSSAATCRRSKAQQSFAPRSRRSAKPSNGSLQSADHRDLPNSPGAALPARASSSPIEKRRLWAGSI